MLRLNIHVLIKVLIKLVLPSLVVAPAWSNELTAARPLASSIKSQEAAERENFAAVLARLNSLIQKEPLNSLLLVKRGRIYSHVGKFQNALKDFSLAVKISPDLYESYQLRAEVYEKLGQYQNEIDDLSSAIRLNPNLQALYEMRGYGLYRLGHLRDAIADCTKVMGFQSDSPLPYRIAAAAYEELGLLDSALALRTKILDLHDKDAFDYRNRARVYELLGQQELAQADRKKAASLANPTELAQMQLKDPLTNFTNPGTETPKDIIAKQLENTPVVLPFHYDSDGHICIPLQVNDHALRFILDTGSETSDLWMRGTSGVAELDHVRLPNTKASGAKYFSGCFRARDLKLGHIVLPRVLMEVDEGLFEHKNLDGFLGGNILENFVVTVDYRKKVVVFSSLVENHDSEEWIVIPLWTRDHLPYCSIRLNGSHEFRAQLDTGSLANMSADSLLKPAVDQKFTFSERSSGPWLGNLWVEPIELEYLELSGRSFQSPIVEVFSAADAPAAADCIILGNSFLSRFKTVTFDYLSKKIMLRPDDTGEVSAPEMFAKGKYFFLHNEQQKAIDAFNKTTALDDDFALSCHTYRSAAYVNLRQYRKALSEITAAIRLEPKNANSYATRAWVYGMLGEFRLQIADDTMAINLEPKNRFAYVNRAFAYERLRNYQLAKRDRQKAHSLAP
ncbi:MAG TPA: hypothetical protein V6C86_20795 [Oculatellaceae cyanobacterium]